MKTFQNHCRCRLEGYVADDEAEDGELRINYSVKVDYRVHSIHLHNVYNTREGRSYNSTWFLVTLDTKSKIHYSHLLNYS